VQETHTPQGIIHTLQATHTPQGIILIRQATRTRLGIILIRQATRTRLGIIHMLQGIPTQQDIIRTLEETIMGQARTPAPTTPILILFGQTTTQHTTVTMSPRCTLHTEILALADLRITMGQ
jgi:hypothetical protein